MLAVELRLEFQMQTKNMIARPLRDKLSIFN